MRIHSFLSTALLLVGLTVAQDPNSGTHSEFFDTEKYTLLDQLLITPKTHSNLFSFTGRWLRSPTGHPHDSAYHATLWSGNSVTILIFGEKATIKLRPKPQGVLEHYSFVVSIDGGPDMLYNTDKIDTGTKGSAHFIPIEFPTPASPQERAPKLLEPHTVRITSISSTPLSFEGLLVENAQISQGLVWEELQTQRPVLEFIGEGLDAERPGGFFRTDTYKPAAGEHIESPAVAILSTLHYKLSELLGVRHSHMTAGTCLLSSCDSRKLPGLETQYFYTSPLDYTGRTPEITDKWDPRHLENLQTPFRFPGLQVPTNPVSHIIVDTGVLDVLVNNQNLDTYTQTLTRFLARLRTQAHPTAKILVIARSGTPNPDSTVIKPDFTTSSLRESLFSATKQAVTLLGDGNTFFAPVKLDGDAQTAYLRAICPHLIPPAGVMAKTWRIFGKDSGGPATKTQKVCAEVLYQGNGAVSGGGVATFVVIGMVVVGLWVARQTVVGAVAAVVGRRRLGMDEEAGVLLKDQEEGQKMW